MATHQKPPFKSEICEYNQRLDAVLRRRVGITVQTYKVIKALAQLVGAAAGIYAMQLGADPMTAFALIAFIIGGPELFEYVMTNGDE